MADPTAPPTPAPARPRSPERTMIDRGRRSAEMLKRLEQRTGTLRGQYRGLAIALFATILEEYPEA